ncbi:hypothetical protein H0H81_007411 [Sphagnurus paluster]|uniref:Uncharacterized protein n=1 Tax=Sphagnurus paluster TaxID=117069 RepID=A0A9P7K4Z2_9AGAR|nr:hypothetical protein H0H81_007411 [Sphagnurus paluster]
MMGELDYALTQLRREQFSSALAMTDQPMTTTTTTVSSRPPLDFQKASELVLHIFIQVLLLGMSIFTLVALWTRASKVAFAVFLLWNVAFYLLMLFFGRYLRANQSISSIIRSRHGQPLDATKLNATKLTTLPPSISEAPSGPYTHHEPPFHVTVGPDNTSIPHADPQSVEKDDVDDDIDDQTRQSIIEGEMGRRDVSIVTIPKRKLWIANP